MVRIAAVERPARIVDVAEKRNGCDEGKEEGPPRCLDGGKGGPESGDEDSGEDSGVDTKASLGCNRGRRADRRRRMATENNNKDVTPLQYAR